MGRKAQNNVKLLGGDKRIKKGGSGGMSGAAVLEKSSGMVLRQPHRLFYREQRRKISTVIIAACPSFFLHLPNFKIVLPFV